MAEVMVCQSPSQASGALACVCSLLEPCRCHESKDRLARWEMTGVWIFIAVEVTVLGFKKKTCHYRIKYKF